MIKTIAVPTKGTQVDSHFGNCDLYTLFDINDSNEVVSKSEFVSPPGCGCKSNVSGLLKEKNVSTLLAGNMGQGAQNKLNESGIAVVCGCEGDIQEVVKKYLQGYIVDSGELCKHHEHDHNHQCEH